MLHSKVVHVYIWLLYSKICANTNFFSWKQITAEIGDYET